MPWFALALALIAGDAMAADLLDDAAARFNGLHTYRVTLRSLDGKGERQVIRYAWRKPGWIRMDFVEPHHGAVLIYNPATRRVRLLPFGPQHLPSFDLAPDNPLIRSPRGHTVDHSDIGTLLAALDELRDRGSVSAAVDAELAGRPASHFEIMGSAGFSVDGVNRYRVWLARDSLFPLKVESFDAKGSLIETVDMSDAELEVGFPERFFAP